MTAALGKTLTIGEVNVGDELPELSIDLTPTVIISTAIASRFMEWSKAKQKKKK